jgi:hypothetical protein
MDGAVRSNLARIRNGLTTAAPLLGRKFTPIRKSAQIGQCSSWTYAEGSFARATLRSLLCVHLAQGRDFRHKIRLRHLFLSAGSHVVERGAGRIPVHPSLFNFLRCSDSASATAIADRLEGR